MGYQHVESIDMASIEESGKKTSTEFEDELQIEFEMDMSEYRRGSVVSRIEQEDSDVQ